MIEKLKEMLEMQRVLDESIEQKHNVIIDVSKVRVAMLDEIGELTHELKARWCWWKKTVNPVDNDKVLEELVDVWHFGLSIHNHVWKKDYPCDFVMEQIEYLARAIGYVNIVRDLLKGDEYVLQHLLLLTVKLGFTMEDIYKAYKEKNQINFERLKNNY